MRIKLESNRHRANYPGVLNRVLLAHPSFWLPGMGSWLNRNINRIRSWLPWRSPEIAEAAENFSPPFIAREDFDPGDKLIFMGDSLFRWRREYRIPATFMARRVIKAGELVRHDPLDQRRSDVAIIWWDDKPGRKNE